MCGKVHSLLIVSVLKTNLVLGCCDVWKMTHTMGGWGVSDNKEVLYFSLWRVIGFVSCMFLFFSFVLKAWGYFTALKGAAEERPWLWALYVVVLLLPILLISICLCPRSGPIKVWFCFCFCFLLLCYMCFNYKYLTIVYSISTSFCRIMYIHVVW